MDLEQEIKELKSIVKKETDMSTCGAGQRPSGHVCTYDCDTNGTDPLLSYLMNQNVLHNDDQPIKDPNDGKYYYYTYESRDVRTVTRDADACCAKFSRGELCSHRFPINEVCVEYCNNDRVAEYVRRTGHDFRDGKMMVAGKSLIDECKDILPEEFKHQMGLAVVKGDPNDDTGLIRGFSSLSSIYTLANGVPVYTAAGMTNVEEILNMAMWKSQFRRSRMPRGVLWTSPLGKETMRNRAFDSSCCGGKVTREGWSVSGDSISFRGIRIECSDLIFTDPTTGLTEAFFIPEDHVQFKPLQDSPLVDTDTKYGSTKPDCWEECIRMTQMGAVVACNFLNLFRIIEIPTDIFLASGCTNGLNPLNGGMFLN